MKMTPHSCLTPALFIQLLCQCLTLELTILHTNDLHSRFDEITSRGSTCKRGDVCFGGVARIKAAVDKIKEENPNRVIFVNGGDFFQVSTGMVGRNREMVIFMLKTSMVCDKLHTVLFFFFIKYFT